MTAEAPIVWSNGGGTQSAAIAVLILTRQLPKPDICAIIDTGREVQSTWDYLNNIVQPEFKKIGIEIHRIPASKYRTVDLYSKTGKLLLPAWTTQSGYLSKLPTYCSNEWKQRVMRRWLREQGIKECKMWLGISWDEVIRMKPANVGWIKNEYPLIEIVRMRRDICVKTVQDYGWPSPPRSRCWNCPHQRKDEWDELPDNEIKAAINLDINIRKKDAHVYLHYSGKPLAIGIEEVDSQSELDLCDSGYCFT